MDTFLGLKVRGVAGAPTDAVEVNVCRGVRDNLAQCTHSEMEQLARCEKVE